MSLELSLKRRKLAKRNFSGKYFLANEPQPKRVRKGVYNIFGKIKLLIFEAENARKEKIVWFSIFLDNQITEKNLVEIWLKLGRLIW